MGDEPFFFDELRITELALKRRCIIMHLDKMLLKLVLFLELIASC